MEIIGKISVKTCGAAPEMELVTIDGKQLPRAKGEQHLLRIIGMCNGLKHGTSEFGPWIAFLGSFEATNVKTGEVFRSSKCLLPESATGALSVAVDNDDETRAVEFGFDIGVKPCATPTGYEYTVKPLVPVSEKDPLEMLKSKLSIPQLSHQAETTPKLEEAKEEPKKAKK